MLFVSLLLRFFNVVCIFFVVRCHHSASIAFSSTAQSFILKNRQFRNRIQPPSGQHAVPTVIASSSAAPFAAAEHLSTSFVVQTIHGQSIQSASSRSFSRVLVILESKARSSSLRCHSLIKTKFLFRTPNNLLPNSETVKRTQAKHGNSTTVKSF